MSRCQQSRDQPQQWISTPQMGALVLQHHLQVNGRFWLASALLRGRDQDLERAAHDASLAMLTLWEPYATERGRAQIRALVDPA